MMESSVKTDLMRNTTKTPVQRRKFQAAKNKAMLLERTPAQVHRELFLTKLNCVNQNQYLLSGTSDWAQASSWPAVIPDCFAR